MGAFEDALGTVAALGSGAHLTQTIAELEAGLGVCAEFRTVLLTDAKVVAPGQGVPGLFRGGKTASFSSAPR